EVNGENGLCLRSDCLLKLRGIEVVRFGIDVHEIDLGAKGYARGGRGNPGEGRGDDAIAGANAKGDKRYKERGCAVAGGAGVLCAAVRGEGILKGNARIAAGGCV